MSCAKNIVRWLVLAACLVSTHAAAERATVAVATNFSVTATALKEAFEASGAHRLRLVAGSTGQLYAQILQGAPFDVFLAADQLRPQKLEEMGHGVPASRFTYAQGQLALWSPTLAVPGPEILRVLETPYVAIANPDLAPYGAAARDSLLRLGMSDVVMQRIVMGQNVGQAYALVDSGAAPFGFVALSSILSRPPNDRGSYWLVPPALYTPILQDAILLKWGKDNAAAAAFLAYLRTQSAQALITAQGYQP